MPIERDISKIIKTRTSIVGDSYEANVFGGHLKYQTNGIYLTSDNGSLIRLNKSGLFMRDADILLKNGSMHISGGTFSIHGTPNGLSSNTYMLMNNEGMSAFKNGVTSFFIDARTGNVSLSGGIFAGYGTIGTWEIYPNGLSSNYNGYTIYLSPEYGINYNDKFFVNPDGAMTATRGLIGSWDIYDNGLSASFSPYAYPVSSFTGGLSALTASFRYDIRLSPEDGFSYNDIFRVTQYGELFAQYAFIKGSICADTGYLNNLEVRGVLTGGKYWYDYNHYLNLKNDTLTAINMNDKFVVLTTGDVYVSNLNATGSITSLNAYLGGWTVDQTTIHQNNLLDNGDRYAVYLSTSSQPSSVTNPSGRGIGYQIFNNGLSSNFYFDSTFGQNLIQTSDSCYTTPTVGNFADNNMVRDPRRIGLQFMVGSGSLSAISLFEISMLSGSTNFMQAPDYKAHIGGWKFDEHGFYSCDNTFRLSSSAGYPSIMIGSQSAGFIHIGSSANITYMNFGTTSSSLNFFNNNITLQSYSLTSNTLYTLSGAWFNMPSTGNRYFLLNNSLTAPTSGREFVCKAYVDFQIQSTLTATLSGITGIAGAGSVNYLAKFDSANSIADSIMAEDVVNTAITVAGSVSADHFYTRNLVPATDDTVASKWYVDQLQGYWSKTGSNIFTTDQVSIGASASPTSTLTAFLVSVTSGRGGYMSGLSVFSPDTFNPTYVYDEYAFSVSGISYFDGMTISDRQYINNSSLTSPLSGTEFVTKDYVDFVSENTVTGTPYYLPMIDNTSVSVTDSIVYQNSDGANLVTVGGNLFVTEQIMAKEKFFNIQHPSYNDPKKRLIHASIETNRNEVEYSGRAEIKEYRCVIQLEQYYNDLVHKDSERVFMTPIGMWNDLFYIGINYEKGLLYFETMNTKDGSFYWMMKAERKDVNKLQAEIL